MEKLMKVYVVVMLLILVLGSLLIMLQIDDDLNETIDFEPMTKQQIVKSIEMGILEVHQTLPSNANDKSMGIIYQTAEGKCYLYQDIFGRYYCRWQ